MSVANPVVHQWNGEERRIYLKQGINAFHWIDDIYIEYRQERRLTEDFRKWSPFMVASGNEPKGGGKATPRLLKLLDDVKVIAWDENIEIYITGEAITDDADNDATLFDNSTRTQPLILNYQPPAAEIIVIDVVTHTLAYGGILSYDENNVTGVGQEYPIGTAAEPANNMVDAQALMLNYHLSKINTSSNIHSINNIEKITIHANHPTLVFYPNGFKSHLCKFDNIFLDGDFNDSYIVTEECTIINALNIYGEIKDSFFNGYILISAGQNLNEADCESGIAGLDSPVVDMHVGVDTTYSARNYSGGKRIINCDTDNCTATLSFQDGGKPHIEPSCTDGILSIRGIGELDDRSNGSTIELKSWIEASDILLTKDILEGDMIPTETEWKILQKTTKAILVQKNTNKVNDLTQLIEP